jgi:hypothetical protein
MMARETRWREGKAPREVAGRAVEPGTWELDGGEFGLLTRSGIAMHYRRGEGVIVDLPDGVATEEFELWFNGSLYAGVAAINGLWPVHASVVVAGDLAFGLTGVSGAGKSTLAASLCDLGLSMLCDDTSLLDMARNGPPICLPGHKRLKLDDKALSATGASAFGPVGGETGKSYARPAGETHREPVPLAGLVQLEWGDDPAINSLNHAQKLSVLAEDHYTRAMYRAAHPAQPSEILAQYSNLAARLDGWRFTRPRDAGRLRETSQILADFLRQVASVGHAR